MAVQLTVFVCSTYSDLSDERDAVLDAIRRLQLQHIAMEFFGARTGRPLETCLAEVRRSNILVVIVGHRYGTLVRRMGIAFSEAEYQEGFRLNKPCLVYIRDQAVPIPPMHMEQDPEKLKLLERWKATLQQRHTVAGFRDTRELAVQVAADLGRTMSEFENTAHARAEARQKSAVRVPERRSVLALLLSSLRRTVLDPAAARQHKPAMTVLTYASSDSAVVREVSSRLMDAGVPVFFDRLIQVGDEWTQGVESELDMADILAFFISPASVRSTWAQSELQSALYRQASGEDGPVILPILLEPADVSPLLRSTPWLDMTDGDVDRAARRLVNVIQHYTQARSRRQPSAATLAESIIKN